MRNNRRGGAPQKAGAPLWTATFGDLMNLLLCFFVMLYAMSTISPEKYEQIRLSFQSGQQSIFDGSYSIIGIGRKPDNPDMIDPKLNDEKEMNEGVSDTSSETEEYNDLENAKESIDEQKQKYSEQMYSDIYKEIDESGISKDQVNLSVDSSYNYIKISIAGSILFSSGATELKKESLPVISKIGDILLKYKGYSIEIEGHTDNVPVKAGKHTYKDNNELSSLRALSAFYYLVNKKGLDPSLVKYSGRGEYDPIASNRTEAGREKNRRVEIKIYNELSSY